MKRGLSVRKPDAKELISFFHGFKRPIRTLNLGLGYGKLMSSVTPDDSDHSDEEV